MRFGMFTYIYRYARYFAGFFHNAETEPGIRLALVKREGALFHGQSPLVF